MGDLDNTKRLMFWLCNMNFRHFNTNRTKITVTVNFSQKETKMTPKIPILFCLVYQEVFSHFPTILDHFERFPKTTENSRGLPKISEDYRRFPRRNPKIQYSLGFPEYCCAWVEKRDYSPFEHRFKVHGPIFEEQIRIYNAKRLWGFHEKPSKHSVFSPETVNITKLANLTANTKNYRQITLNTKTHSDPLKGNHSNLATNSRFQAIEFLMTCNT